MSVGAAAHGWARQGGVEKTGKVVGAPQEDTPMSSEAAASEMAMRMATTCRRRQLGGGCDSQSSGMLPSGDRGRGGGRRRGGDMVAGGGLPTSDRRLPRTNTPTSATLVRRRPGGRGAALGSAARTAESIHRRRSGKDCDQEGDAHSGSMSLSGEKGAGGG